MTWWNICAALCSTSPFLFIFHLFFFSFSKSIFDVILFPWFLVSHHVCVHNFNQISVFLQSLLSESWAQNLFTASKSVCVCEPIKACLNPGFITFTSCLSAPFSPRSYSTGLPAVALTLVKHTSLPPSVWLFSVTNLSACQPVVFIEFPCVCMSHGLYINSCLYPFSKFSVLSSLLPPLPWHSDCQAKVDGQEDTCACLCVCASVLLWWLGESRAGWALIEARNNIKANLSFLCLCLLRSPWHSVTQWLPHLSHHLDLVSGSFSLFGSLGFGSLIFQISSILLLRFFFLVSLLKYTFLNIQYISCHLSFLSMMTKKTKIDIENVVCTHRSTLTRTLNHQSMWTYHRLQYLLGK